jgi:Protein of unknown function (DUF3551)
LTLAGKSCLLANRGQRWKEDVIRMRMLALAILAIGTVFATWPAQAQAWDPNYPVCMQVFGRFNSNECRYTSLPQCNASASGRAAECVLNPYFARAEVAQARPYRRHRHVY